ncbi:uncharacterized protein TRIADDRAFT_24240 [Trichoplax adhaerens]|uniref:Glyoxalase domain-containing protein 5 n=1 Tax=Trichoplax adhaerens TaxID=10228 RepID=B3RVL8_TRIAD|nr:hypothetical protein TRIADDRAFT_24240 [Trichoplax adhaerens]EDV25522.1 hypothetical protein TRIADDRAFT_24240 [Trichoplax adhaerens]|eukprot:XP_002111555.1 hypothetical protein TRIADDRAFT_24240 [Trichoplax adhaerens]
MIKRLDHLVLTVRDVQATCAFYTRYLQMELITFKGDRKALKFGQQKINLHQYGNEFEPKAHHPTPGSGDLCFITSEPIKLIQTRLESKGIRLEEGPVQRTGANGPILSIYFRDPDGNLLELSNEL